MRIRLHSLNAVTRPHRMASSSKRAGLAIVSEDRSRHTPRVVTDGARILYDPHRNTGRPASRLRALTTPTHSASCDNRHPTPDHRVHQRVADAR